MSKDKQTTGSDDKQTIVSSANELPTIVTAAKDATRIRPKPTTAGQPQLANIAEGFVLKERFVFEQKLGQGAMGAVFKAKDLRKEEAGDPNPYIAIKLIAGDFKQDPRAFVALQQETDKSQSLSHKNIISVYDFDRDGDIIFMTMQCLEGQSLDSYIANPDRALSAKEKRANDMALIVQVIDGMSYAHEQGIVHSDLKPENIFVTVKNEIKILDFGIARAISQIRNDGYVDDREDIIGLTPPYASVEMFEGQAPHTSDDVYALGLISYEVLTNEHPFDKKRSIDVLRDGNEASLIKSIASYQWKAINKAISLQRDNRWENGQQFLKALTGTGRSTRFLIAGIVLASIGLATLSFLYTNVDQTGPEVEFSNLADEKKTAIEAWLVSADTALSFDDYNGAIFYFDKINALHPRNRRAAKRLDTLVDTIIKRKAALEELGVYDSTINDLLTFPSLKLNQRLLKEQRKLKKVTSSE